MIKALRRRAEEVFQLVAELAPEQRATFLDENCATEPDVRAEVESLLKHLDNETITSLETATSAPTQDPDLASQRIGPYKLLQLIGEGGFGSVYMAEQEQPVRRRVAFKIIKLGMDTRQVIARFEAERQALAMMEHTNIARVYDAGATDTGRPYFVMELVKGIPITDYCDRNSLSTRQRLELFIQVCRAVQHAHLKGIIHRDIKPSNVMVTLHDGTPVPKIIDFGIAKATSQRLTDKTLFTEFLQFIGTPQYMSPEQAEMSGLDVDARTDLYSLGVLLYELLTGTTPFDAATMRDATYTEIQRVIREVDPPTPSRRLSTLGDQLPEIANSRRAEPQALSKLVRGDLDWIVMKALEKDRSRRYETASAMATDIERHLNDEPVAAGPPGAGYKLRKFIRRHRVGVVAGSLVVLALVLGLALATVGFVQASRGRDRALVAEKIAQEQADSARDEAESAKAINAFFNNMLTSVDPMQVRLLSAYAPDEKVASLSAGGFPRDVSVAEMVRRTAVELDRAFAGKPELEATSRETIGMTLRGLGLFADAKPQLEAAFDIRRRTLGEDHPDTLRAALALGDLMLDAGKGAEAEPLVKAAFAGMEEVYGPRHRRTLSCASIVAAVLSDQGKYKESEAIFRETLKAQEQTLGPEHRDTLTTMWKMSASYLSQWKLAEGEALARQLHDIAAKTLSPDDSLNILSKPLMGWWYLERYEYEKAESVLRPGLEHCRRILGPQHPFTYMTMNGLARSLQGAELQEQKEQLHREALAGLRATRGRLHWHTISSTTNFARWLNRRGKFAEAEQLFRAVVADCTRSLGDDDSRTLSAMHELAGFLERMGKVDEAASMLAERLAIFRKLRNSSDVYQLNETDMQSRALIRMGRIDEARALTRELLSRFQEMARKRSDDPAVLNTYAWALLTCVPADLRDPATALPIAEKAVKLDQKESSALLDTLAFAYHLSGDNDQAVTIQKKSLELLPLEARRDLIYSGNLVRYLRKQGDLAAADRVVLEGVEMFRQALGEDNPILAPQFNKNGLWLAELGYYSIAESLLREAVELNRKILGEEHEQVAASLKNLADIYHQEGKYDLAESAYRSALAIRRKLLGDDDVSVPDTMYALATTLHDGGDPSAAASIMGEVLDIYDKLGAGDIPAAIDTRRRLAQVLIERGSLDETEPLARNSLAQARALFGDQHLSTVLANGTWGLLLIERGNAQEAESLLRTCVDIHRELDLPEQRSWLTAQADNTLGYCLLALQRFDEAEPLLLESYRAIRHAKGDSYTGTRTALERLVALYETWDKPEQAAKWRTEAAGRQPPSPPETSLKTP